jgi:hypothetical protein
MELFMKVIVAAANFPKSTFLSIAAIASVCQVARF